MGWQAVFRLVGFVQPVPQKAQQVYGIGKLGFQPVQLSLLGDKGRIQLSEAFFLKELTFLKSGQTLFNIPPGSYPPVA